MKRTILVIIFAFLLQSFLLYGNDQVWNLDDAYSKAVAGDIRPILSFFQTIKNVNQSEFADLYNKYEKRFIKADKKNYFDDPLITNLYDLYTTYWRVSLTNPDDEKKARKALLSGLINLANAEGRESSIFEYIIKPSFTDLENFFIQSTKKRGYYLLMGVTTPLRELMIWTNEVEKNYIVKLPSESFSVDVIFAQNFLSKGWLGYATFDVKHTGGWQRGDTIFRVGEIPEDNDEWFRVSLLGHEGRHISDLKKYGKLDSWLLEYRAKITELILADDSFWLLLNSFKNEASDDISIPHAYASYTLINDTIEELNDEQKVASFETFPFVNYSKEKIKNALENIFDRNTKTLQNI